MTRPSRAELAVKPAPSWWAWDMAWLEPFRAGFAADRARCFSEIRWRVQAVRSNLRSSRYGSAEHRALHMCYALEHLCVALWLRDVARHARRGA